MAIKMMFIPESHDAITTLESLGIGMRNHVAFQMRASLERFPASLLSTDVISGFTMSLSHVAIVVRGLLEVFIADLASLVAFLLWLRTWVLLKR